ncbi:MAG: SGNH/GDSL hydrolase family protein [Lachnospiraceae bacterium]|nr:SGNH/GDSL hydrolase family protein [Lachnospiraceae bacterium]
MGPIAPKDPVKKRDFFYIMYDKQVFAAETPNKDGRGICYLYQSDGRMINSAKIIGNVQDEELLGLMRTTEGFRKLVYGIAVSMISNEHENANFVFQMYGKTDPYVSGTSIEQTITPDGVEYLIPLTEVNWSDDDKEPGQIRFEFDKPGISSTVYVKFYLNDGYKAPAFEPAKPVDLESDEYKAMIGQSLVAAGNSQRLKALIAKAQSGEEVTLAYIGGSITQGAGATPLNKECYAYKMFSDFNEKYAKNHNAKFIKAGVGGTPSEFGIVRFENDVLNNPAADAEPDLVVIEFAVNDAGDETNGECYEGLVRRCLQLSSKPAVILLFSVFADDYNLQDRLIPIGEHYNLPMVSLKNAVTKQFYQTYDEGRIVSKSQYFYDTYHPTNLGHTIMSDCLMNCVANAASASDASEFVLNKPYFTDEFDCIHSFDRADYTRLINADGDYAIYSIDEGDFTGKDEQLQYAEKNADAFGTPQFPNNWKHISGSKALVIEAKFKLLMVVTLDNASPSVGEADVYVDGKFVKTINPHEVGWTHCNAQIISRNNETANHKVEFRMHEGDEDKAFTILGFGII